MDHFKMSRQLNETMNEARRVRDEEVCPDAKKAMGDSVLMMGYALEKIEEAYRLSKETNNTS